MSRHLFLAVALCAACGAGTGTSESFLTGLPSRQTLEIASPPGQAPAALVARSGALVGQTADLYVLTRSTTGTVNGVVGHTLDTLGAITHGPPAVTGPDSAAWGPITDALSPVAGRLVIERVGPGAFAFRLDLRPRSGGDSDFQTFLQGASTGAGPAGPSQGSFSADLALAHRLDPIANPTAGQLVAAWAAAPDHREVHVRFADVVTGSDLPATADIGTVVRADGSGALAFDAQANLFGDPATLETGRVRSQWRPDGAGRADVEAHGGDAAGGLLVTECWDSSFREVYATGTAPDGGVGSEGDPAACAFSAPLQ